MNIILDGFPEIIEVAGKNVLINSDFKNCLRIIMAFEDEELTIVEKAGILLQLLYIDEIPQDNIQEAYEKGIIFLNCNDEAIGVNTETRLYSFEKDSKYIYSAIKASHNIELTKAELHWWQFCYLFFDIDKDCFFSKIIDYRSRWHKGTLSEEEVKFCQSIQDILFDEDSNVEDDQIVSEFMSILREEG